MEKQGKNYEKQEKDSNKIVADVIIVGSGISGVACARKLKELGFSTIILEARDRIGGRLLTIEFNNEKIDVGACFIHGACKENPIYRLVKNLEISPSMRDSWGELELYNDGQSLDIVLPYKKRAHVEDTFNFAIKRVQKLANQILSYNKLEEYINLSVSDGIKNIFEENKNMKPNWKEDSVEHHYWNYLTWVYEEFEGISFEKQSLLNFGKDEHLPGGNMALENGFGELIKLLSLDLDIRLEHIVQSIEGYDSDNILIKTNQGEFFCNKVVLSVPLGVLKSNNINFSPQLPSYKLEAIEKLDMGTMNKIVLRFPYFFWDRSINRIYHVSKKKGEFPWFDSYSTDEPILLGWVACEYAEELEKFNDEIIINIALEVLQNIFPDKVVPKPIETFVTKWKSDIYSGGSWSVRPIGSKFEYISDLSKNVDNLFFCGEATHAKHSGTVHGAYLSGEEQANNIFLQQKFMKFMKFNISK